MDWRIFNKIAENVGAEMKKPTIYSWAFKQSAILLAGF